MKGPASSNPTIKNRKASFQYELLEQIECGLALTGSEVKSLRGGRVSLDEAYGYVRDGEIFLRACNIAPYEQAGYAQHEPLRERKLLLHRREIRKLAARVELDGLTLVPVRIFFNEAGKAKLILALARGKKLHDKRESVKAREAGREMQRAMSRRR